jgi:hypothetical protein
MKRYRGVEIRSHAFLTAALGGGEWLASHPETIYTREKSTSTHWIGGWVGPSAGLDAAVKRENTCP